MTIKLALIEKIKSFYPNLLANFENTFEHMVEKFEDKDLKRLMLRKKRSFERSLL